MGGVWGTWAGMGNTWAEMSIRGWGWVKEGEGRRGREGGGFKMGKGIHGLRGRYPKAFDGYSYYSYSCLLIFKGWVGRITHG